MVSNQEDIEPYQHKSFHELLLELRNVGLKARDLIEEAIRQGQREGIPNDEIRRQILDIGIPYRTMLEYIPEDMKQKQTHAKSKQKVASLQPTYKRDQSRLVIEGEPPKLPPREEQYVEPEPEEEPSADELAEVAEFNQQVREEVTQPRRHEDGIIPYALAEQLSKFLMSRLIGMARANGDPGVRFKINDQGEAYFP